MPSPFEEGGQTQTIDIPDVEIEPPRQQTSLPWIVIAAATVLLLGLLVLAIAALGG